MNLIDVWRVFGRLFCLLGFHDLQVVDKSFGFGGGGSGYALWIDSDFRFGSSNHSETFGNMELTEGREFECVNLEVCDMCTPAACAFTLNDTYSSTCLIHGMRASECPFT